MASSPVTAPPSGDASSPPSPPATTSPPGVGSSPPGDGSSPPAPPTSTSPPSNSSSSSSPPAPPTSASPPSNSSSSSPPPAQSPPSPPPASSPPSNSSKTPPSSPPPSGQTPPPSGQTNPAPPAPTTGGGEGSSTSPPADGGSPPATPTPPAAGSGGGTTPASPPPADNNNPSPTPPNSSSVGGSGSPPPGGSSDNSPALPATPSSPSLTPPSSSSGGLLSPPMGGTMVAEPPPAHKTPSAKHTTPSSGTTSSSPTAPSTTAVVGVGVSAALIALVMVVLCVTCASKKKNKKRKHGGNMQYYADHSAGPKGGEYYSGQNNWNNANHVMKVPPPPGMGGGSWGPPQGPASGDMSGNFSGGPHGGQMPPPTPGLSLGFNKSTFSYDELAAATNGFSQANLLGQGGFGFVHKGVLPNGKEIAVKSLKSGSGQGEREFQAEVEIISRVHHRHLVSLVGYCIAEDRRMLVYEFVPNGTMEYHLHGKGRPTMDWPARLRIALGSAKGLAYLHEDCHPRIIHRDIKAANILIDNNFEAMVADFGLAKLSSDNYTHVSTRVMGTFGYLAPEYASSGKLTEKSDVFSFGIMLLELITGRKPVDTTNTYMEDSLVDWARPILSRSLEDGNFDELVDPNLEGNYSPPELSCMVACAAAAVRHSAKRRPKMSQIVRALEGDASLDDLNEGVKPGQSSMYSSNGSSDYDTGLYNADMQKFRKVVMSSQEFASSEYGGTSEYGLNPSSSSGDSQEMSQPWKRNPQPRNNNIS